MEWHFPKLSRGTKKLSVSSNSHHSSYIQLPAYCRPQCSPKFLHFWAWLRLSNLKRCASILAEFLIPLRPTGHLRLAHTSTTITTTPQHYNMFVRIYISTHLVVENTFYSELRPLRILKLIRTSLVWIHGPRAIVCRKLPSAKTCWPHGLNFENRIES